MHRVPLYWAFDRLMGFGCSGDIVKSPSTSCTAITHIDMGRVQESTLQKELSYGGNPRRTTQLYLISIYPHS